MQPSDMLYCVQHLLHVAKQMEDAAESDATPSGVAQRLHRCANHLREEAITLCEESIETQNMVVQE